MHATSGVLNRVMATLIALLCLNACQPETSNSGGSDANAGQSAADSSSTDEIPHLFTDVTEKSGLLFHHFNGMTGELLMPEIFGSGVALLDYDRDGDLDVFFVQGGTLPGTKETKFTFPPKHTPAYSHRLYENRWFPDGVLRFVDRTSDTMPLDKDTLAAGYGMGVATLDFDQDGWMDLFVTRLGSNQMLKNLGGTGFQDVSVGLDDPGWGTSAVACDLDQDGKQELLFVNYLQWSLERRVICTSAAGRADYCGPKAYPPSPNRLYHNEGSGQFTEIGSSSGISARPGASLGAVCADFDADGRPDLYIANDQMANELWINQGDLKFLQQAELRGAAVNLDGLPEASMGVIASDVDHDGDLDLFMTHLIRESNTLYENDGAGYFYDRSRNSGMSQESWMMTGFGLGVADFNGDGWRDFYIANGSVLRLEERLSAGDPHPLDEPDQLFLGHDKLRFVPGLLPASPGLEPGVGRGVAVGDLDNDGDIDIVVSNNGGPVRVLRNDSNPDPDHWIGLDSAMGQSAGALFDARVVAGLKRPGNDTIEQQYFFAGSGGSYLSAMDPRVLIAVPDGHELVHLKVYWSSGEATDLDPGTWQKGHYMSLTRPPGGQNAGQRIGPSANP